MIKTETTHTITTSDDNGELKVIIDADGFMMIKSDFVTGNALVALLDIMYKEVFPGIVVK